MVDAEDLERLFLLVQLSAPHHDPLRRNGVERASAAPVETHKRICAGNHKPGANIQPSLRRIHVVSGNYSDSQQDREEQELSDLIEGRRMPRKKLLLHALRLLRGECLEVRIA